MFEKAGERPEECSDVVICLSREVVADPTQQSPILVLSRKREPWRVAHINVDADVLDGWR
jgi:hypothetical protein